MHKWIGKGIFEDAYKKVLKLYMKHHPTKYYCIDSSYVKNAFGRDVVGRNPVDRGRKATKEEKQPRQKKSENVLMIIRHSNRVDCTALTH